MKNNNRLIFLMLATLISKVFVTNNCSITIERDVENKTILITEERTASTHNKNNK